jgi:hypothetical protein
LSLWHWAFGQAGSGYFGDTLEQLKAILGPGIFANCRTSWNVQSSNETNTFLVDESWLKGESPDSSPREGLSALANREVQMIETALAAGHGRISGPSGAGAKLGIARQTLESKIRRLGIDKYGRPPPPNNGELPLSSSDNGFPMILTSPYASPKVSRTQLGPISRFTYEKALQINSQGKVGI